MSLTMNRAGVCELIPVTVLRRWVRKELLASRDRIHLYLSLTISSRLEERVDRARTSTGPDLIAVSA
jgi:hypothetical protein